jgi:hypothetical protein
MPASGSFDLGDHPSGGGIRQGGAGEADKGDKGLADVGLAGLKRQENGVTKRLGADLASGGVANIGEAGDGRGGR